MISFLKHPLTSNQVSKHAKLNNLEIKIMQYVSTNVNTELSYKEDFYRVSIPYPQLNFTCLLYRFSSRLDILRYVAFLVLQKVELISTALCSSAAIHHKVERIFFRECRKAVDFFFKEMMIL